MERGFGSYLVLVFVLAVSCGDSSSITMPAPSVLPAQQTCEQFGQIPILNGEYVVQNNRWNSPDSVQCIEVGPGTSWRVVRADLDKPNAGPPASYPFVLKGCHWGKCTSRNPLPIQVANLKSATSEWSTVQPGGGAYNVSYDLWYHSQPVAAGSPDGAELMIWIHSEGGVQPAGSRRANVNIGGVDWEVWYLRMDSWNYIAYVRKESTAIVNLDLKAFTQDAVERGMIQPSWYLIAVEAGFEIWRGGVGLATNSFSFTGS